MSSFRNFKQEDGVFGELIRRSLCCGLSSTSSCCPKFGDDDNKFLHIEPKSIKEHNKKVRALVVKTGLDVCCICRESILERSAVSTACGHLFHPVCLDSWSRQAVEKKMEEENLQFSWFGNEDNDDFAGGLRSVMLCFSRFSVRVFCPICRNEICAAHQVSHPTESLTKWQREYEHVKNKNKKRKRNLCEKRKCRKKNKSTKSIDFSSVEIIDLTT